MSGTTENPVTGSAARISQAALAASLPANIRYLSRLIARKPAKFTPQWAAAVDEAFSLYTRTSTINLLVSQSDLLAEANWPFPSYVDLRRELAREVMDWRRHLRNLDGYSGRLRALWKFLRREVSFTHVTLFSLFAQTPRERAQMVSTWMVLLFWRDSRAVFSHWRSCPMLAAKLPIVRDIERTYRKGYWAACAPTVLSLLDFVVRTYFGTDWLNVSIQTLRNAFEKARVLPSDLKPGFAILSGKLGFGVDNRLATTLEEDLRLPGVLLASFVQFADAYYGWYRRDLPGRPILNRHAIQHCAADYWTRENATKLLTFLDLALRLRRPLEVLIHGPNAPWLKAERANDTYRAGMADAHGH